MKQQIDCTLIDRLASLLVAAIVLGGLGCAEDPVSPSTPALAAVAVAAPLAFSTVSAGGSHTCALAGDGRVYCWGLNQNGQLGDGTRTNHSSP